VLVQEGKKPYGRSREEAAKGHERTIYFGIVGLFSGAAGIDERPRRMAALEREEGRGNDGKPPPRKQRSHGYRRRRSCVLVCDGQCLPIPWRLRVRVRGSQIILDQLTPCAIFL
jgi:hypothetical protein